MHQPTPSTICFNQHPWIVNHKLIIQPYYACLWGLGNFMFLLLCSPLEFDQNRITYHLLASFCPSEGKSTNPWHDPAVSECLDLPWSFRLKAGCVCTFQQEDGPVKPSGQLFVSQCAQLHFSIDSLKYVFESGFFHEWSFALPPASSYVYETSQILNNIFNYFVAHQWWFRQPSNTRVGQTLQWCEGCGKLRLMLTECTLCPHCTY